MGKKKKKIKKEEISKSTTKWKTEVLNKNHLYLSRQIFCLFKLQISITKEIAQMEKGV